MVLPSVGPDYPHKPSMTTTNHNSGVPHSIQALDAGVEFLLVFDDGDFSEDNTFLASQVFSHNPVGLPNPP